MLRILFWNLHKKDLRHLICELVSHHSVDVVALLESATSAAGMLDQLRSEVSLDFAMPPAITERFQVFSRDLDLGLQESYGGDRLCFRQLNHRATKMLLGLVHIVDRRNWDGLHQSGQIQLMADEIRRHESDEGHSRTILIGDFNMNPYSPAMNIATGMNALMTKRCASRGSRVLQGIEYPFFYNPMWGLFGDRIDGPPGTYYHNNSTKGTYGWNMLDQVLIRPDAINSFEAVEILSNTGSTSLVGSARRPNRGTASDHLPLLLKLK